MTNEDKRVPLNLVCRHKNKERLTNLLNTIINQFEIDGKKEDYFLNKKIVIQKEVVNSDCYVFLERSTKVGEDFKSLLDCLKTNDETTLKQHFKRNFYAQLQSRY